MAFMGMMFAAVFIVILLAHIFLTFLSFVLAVILKLVGRKKENKKMKIAGNVFLVLGILLAIPLAALAAYIAFHAAFIGVTMPDGETQYVPRRCITIMASYVEDPDEESLAALEKLLDKHSELVFYRDVNRKSILERGLVAGNADIVRLALEHGAIFDNPERYDHVSYEVSSMDDYLSCYHTITQDDIEILEMMFENGADTEVYTLHDDCYSNAFGKAVWLVLYNDTYVTDTELEFLQVLIDNGISEDPQLLLLEEAPSNIYFDDSFYEYRVRDDNYIKLMGIIGK